MGDVVGVVNGVEQLHHLLGFLADELDVVLRHHGDLGVFGRDLFGLDGGEHGVEGVGGGEHLPSGAVVAEVFGTSLEHDGEQLVFAGGGLGDGDGAVLFEHPGHAAGLAHVAVVLGHHVADLTDGAVAVVGGDVHEDGDAAGAVALQGELFIDDAGELAGAALDGALDVVGGHVLRLGGEHGAAQAGIGVGVAAAGAGGDGNFLDQAGEGFAALGVGGRLFMLDRGPFGVSRHGSEGNYSIRAAARVAGRRRKVAGYGRLCG